ncbi:MAG: tRNA adenosine(34) deaminase TadA [Christensenellales bacterium]|jgi:tRNA(adenine34) deaminase
MDWDERFMRAAIREAMKAAEKDEVPVGAVIVRSGRIIARGHNLRETRKDPIAHAEMIAIGKAARRLGGWRLEGCSMYVTLEPCPMCAGALINSRMEAVYFGAYDPKGGCCGSLYNLPQDVRFNHRLQVVGGILGDECGRVLTEYFRRKRLLGKGRQAAKLGREGAFGDGV